MQAEMTQEQRSYFLRRLDEITQEKISAKEKELYGDAGQNAVTWGEVFAAIKAGEIVLKEGTESLTRPYLMPQDVEWPARKEKADALTAYRKTLEVERQRATDAVMLNSAATEALSRYAAV